MHNAAIKQSLSGYQEPHLIVTKHNLISFFVALIHCRTEIECDKNIAVSFKNKSRLRCNENQARATIWSILPQAQVLTKVSPTRMFRILRQWNNSGHLKNT